MNENTFGVYMTIVITVTITIILYFAYLEVQKESIHYNELQEKIKIIEHTYGRDFESYNEYLVYRIDKGE